jgi:hypothetical protein
MRNITNRAVIQQNKFSFRNNINSTGREMADVYSMNCPRIAPILKVYGYLLHRATICELMLKV